MNTQVSPRFSNQTSTSKIEAPMSNNPTKNKYNSKGLYSQASNNKVDAITERKEVSKRQAKERRDRERAEFEQLMNLLPNDCPNEKNYNLQLALGYILVRSLFKNKNDEIPRPLSDSTENNVSGRLKHSLGLIKAGLNGFVIGFIVKGTCAGRIIYISENVVNYLGYESRYIQGRYIWDLMHNSDVDLLAESLGFEDTFIWDADIEDWRVKDCNNNIDKKKVGAKTKRGQTMPQREFLQKASEK